MEYSMTPPAFEVPTTAPTVIAYAGFWRRFLASLIDMIVIGAGQTVLALIFGVGLIGRTGSWEHNGGVDASMFTGGVALVWLVSWIGSWVYFAAMEASANQATLGKMALGLRVTDLEGRRISFGQSVGRTLAKLLSAMTLLIGYIMAGFTPKKQAMHDMIAGTLVLTRQTYVPSSVAQNAFAAR